jgi:hypothetical protein
MKGAPLLSPGTVEQAIFTWSHHRLEGGEGVGIADASPGLRNHIPWLNSLDLKGLRPFDPALCDEAHGYEGWRRLEANGALPVGNLTVAFRKIASAGDDGAFRNRFVVHLLVGRGEDLDLGTLAEDDPHWLRAEQCPLDEPPKLPTLSVEDLLPFRTDHDCATFDSVARQLLVDLLSEPGRSKTVEPVDVPALTKCLLVALPTALWSRVELGFWVGSQGPIGRIALHDHDGAGRREPTAPGLGGCALHARSEAIWAGLPPGRGTVAAFAASFGTTSVRCGGPVTFDFDGSARSDRVRAIASEIEDPAWDGTEPLDDLRAMRALTALERLPISAKGWLKVLDDDEIAAIFSGFDSSPGFSRVVQFFRDTSTPVEDIAASWRRTSLAAMGVGALALASGAEADGSIGVPDRLDLDELEKLVRFLRRHKDGIERLAILVREFAPDADARADIVAALQGVGAGTAEIFDGVLARAQLPPATQLEFMRDNLHLTVAWLGVSEDYREALELVLAERPRFSVQLGHRSIRVFDA